MRERGEFGDRTQTSWSEPWTSNASRMAGDGRASESVEQRATLVSGPSTICLISPYGAGGSRGLQRGGPALPQHRPWLGVRRVVTSLRGERSDRSLLVCVLGNSQFAGWDIEDLNLRPRPRCARPWWSPVRLSAGLPALAPESDSSSVREPPSAVITQSVPPLGTSPSLSSGLAVSASTWAISLPSGDQAGEKSDTSMSRRTSLGRG